MERWTDEDKALVMAFQLEKALVCAHCGTASWQWDPDQGGDPTAFTAIAHRCEGCGHLDVARETLTTSKRPGVTVRLVPTAVADRMAQTPKRRPKSKRERAGTV